jgi:mono/diheme cytochrome c family protein
MGARASGLYPDLRFSGPDVHDRWNDIVLGGIRAAGGMASFADVLGPDEAAAIQSYVLERAHHEPDALESAAAWLMQRACIPTSWVTD